ncbi:MAG: DUF1987 domain-containing protein [Bacteroidales bacterium]|nr:DUF1987 domain-containing protein [Bacteroidales bacterium]HPD94905.1 DUF1987 domain-containing protein [Tenuifilaceae bacterium]HRX30680.1 DUF1987 domain-containing protein [Tenuifilaceae bacterium]
MEKLHVERKTDSPEIIANAEEGYFEINGKSLPEDAVEFYKPLEKYVLSYINRPKQTTTINLKLEYLNSSSSKKLLDIIELFEKIQKQGYEIILNWYHHDDDQDMIDEGVEFAHMTSLKVNFISEQ